MKVRATGKYEELNVSDGVLGRIPKQGEVFEVDETRFKTLNGNNGYNAIFVEKVEEKIEEAVAPTPKKRTAKKKTTK